jgi:hypothetical protein
MHDGNIDRCGRSLLREDRGILHQSLCDLTACHQLVAGVVNAFHTSTMGSGQGVRQSLADRDESSRSI